MSYQSEAELENLLVKHLKEQGYEKIAIKTYQDLEDNFKQQFFYLIKKI